MTLKEARSLLATRQRNRKETLALIEQTPDFQGFRDQLAEVEAEIHILKAFLAAQAPKLVVGVDPAMAASGFAFRGKDGGIHFGRLDGIENLSSGNALKVAAKHSPGDKAPVYLLIEYPTWKGHGAETIRAAANAWIRAFRAAFPRRVRLMKLTPQTWMARMIPGWGKMDSKKGEHPRDLYRPLAVGLVGDPLLADLDENAAAAVCLQTLAERLIASGEWGQDLRKTKKAAKS